MELSFVALKLVIRTIKKWLLPIFILEMHSSPYKQMVAKTIVVLIDQLRLLRCFINGLVGFAFPKYDTDTCVTTVTVSSTDFTFDVRFLPLDKTCMKEESS